MRFLIAFYFPATENNSAFNHQLAGRIDSPAGSQFPRIAETSQDRCHLNGNEPCVGNNNCCSTENTSYFDFIPARCKSGFCQVKFNTTKNCRYLPAPEILRNNLPVTPAEDVDIIDIVIPCYSLRTATGKTDFRRVEQIFLNKKDKTA